MAAMDIEKARALAEQMIRTGQNKGRSLEDLVRQIVTESAGAPQTATGAGLMIAPPPRTVTPATPAPMQPGVPLVAPKPTAQTTPQPEPQPQAEAPQRAAPRPSRYQPELDRVLAELGAAKKAMSDAVASGQKPNVTDQIRLAAMEEKADRLGALVRAEGSPEAEIPEEMRAALESRQARLARREELLAEAKTRSPWEALLAGGAAMAQGRRGENFGEALTRGLQTGIQEYGRARRAGEEGAESIAEARDQALMDRYNMREQAVANARQRALEMMNIGDTSRERAVANIETPLRLRKGEAEVGKAEFDLKNAPAAAALERSIAEARIRDLDRGGRDRDKEMTANQRYNAEQNFIKADEKMKEALEEYKADYEQAGGKKASMDSAKFTAYKAALDRRESMRRTFQKVFGAPPADAGPMLLPDGAPAVPVAGRRAATPSAPPVPGARLAPDGKYYVPDPKRPGKYLQVG